MMGNAAFVFCLFVFSGLLVFPFMKLLIRLISGSKSTNILNPQPVVSSPRARSEAQSGHVQELLWAAELHMSRGQEEEVFGVI